MPIEALHSVVNPNRYPLSIGYPIIIWMFPYTVPLTSPSPKNPQMIGFIIGFTEVYHIIIHYLTVWISKTQNPKTMTWFWHLHGEERWSRRCHNRKEHNEHYPQLRFCLSFKDTLPICSCQETWPAINLRWVLAPKHSSITYSTTNQINICKKGSTYH